MSLWHHYVFAVDNQMAAMVAGSLSDIQFISSAGIKGSMYPRRGTHYSTKDLVPSQNILGETLTVGNYPAGRGLTVLFLFSSYIFVVSVFSQKWQKYKKKTETKKRNLCLQHTWTWGVENLIGTWFDRRTWVKGKVDYQYVFFFFFL